MGKSYPQLSLEMSMESITGELASKLRQKLGRGLENEFRLVVGGVGGQEIWPTDSWRQLREYTLCLEAKRYVIEIVTRLAGPRASGAAASSPRRSSTRTRTRSSPTRSRTYGCT